MSPPGSPALKEPPVGQKKPKQPRKRARDEGTLMPLGVEVETTIYDAVEKTRTAKKWSKRTLVEEALRRYCTEEGFPPEPQS